MIKVLVVFGTRPEAIKMAPVVAALARRPQLCTIRVCVTAQHRQMLDQALRLFAITPDYDLNVMAPNQSLTGVAAAVLAGMEPVLRQEMPDWVLVQGDTTTVAAAALAAYYAHARVGHVEAGLRTNNKWQPFPEEINRRIAGVIADMHFAPTPAARMNLLREGVREEQILVTGNTVIDALHTVAAQPFDQASLDPAIRAVLAAHESGARIILVTAHRRENFGVPLEQICLALHDLAARYGDTIRIIYPVHLNPNVQAIARTILGDVSQITLTDPLDYAPLVFLMRHTTLALTDSGGIQEEAPALGIPVLVLREVTERPEAVAAGTVRLVGTDRDRIVGEAARLLDDPAAHMAMARAINPYGDGQAAERIADSLCGEAVQEWSEG